MKVVTVEQMRRIDRVTIDERGIPGNELMERAGRAVADEMCERFESGPTAVVAGKGNNAGDGFVVARLLVEREWPVTAFLLSDPADLSGDAKAMFDAMPGEVKQVRVEDPAQLGDALAEFDLAVDAILGTGIQGPATGLYGDAIEVINGSGLPVVSVDIPSGLPGDGGSIEGPVVRAVHTVTMGLPKIGTIVYPGIEFTGTMSVADLDFPRDLLGDPDIRVNLLTETMIANYLPPRPADGHKGTFGSLIVVGGSRGMTGAPVLACRAAMRSGVGLVFCATTDALQPIVASQLVEELTIPLPAIDGDRLDVTSVTALVAGAVRMKAAAVGPGLGRNEETQRFVRKVAEEIPLPMVIDADGLNALGGHMDVLHSRGGPTVLTPHPGEISRLTGLSISEVQADRIGVARKVVEGFRAVVLLKGAQTIIADLDGTIYINPTGNTGLSKGGSGDVLTGLIGGLLGQKCGALPAAACGAFLHGLAADLAAATIPPRTMIASDVVDHLPEAMQVISEF